nr:hypothetical protein Iba_chr05cCG12970 [Ipomoea batatas]
MSLALFQVYQERRDGRGRTAEGETGFFPATWAAFLLLQATTGNGPAALHLRAAVKVVGRCHGERNGFGGGGVQKGLKLQGGLQATQLLPLIPQSGAIVATVSILPPSGGFGVAFLVRCRVRSFFPSGELTPSCCCELLLFMPLPPGASVKATTGNGLPLLHLRAAVKVVGRWSWRTTALGGGVRRVEVAGDGLQAT